jgi:hypothetical protein
MESRENNQFDQEVKSKFEDFTPPVPLDLWDEIENQLNIIESNKNKLIKRARFSFLEYGSVAATILIAFLFWKLGNTGHIYLEEIPEVYTSKIPFEGNLPQQKDNEELYPKEELLDADHFAEAPLQKRAMEKVNVKPPQAEIAKSNTKPRLENILGEDEFNNAYIEPAYSSSLNEMSALAENAPFDNREITLQDSLPLQEEITGSLIDGMDRPRNKRLGVSTVLNFLAKGLSNESGNSIEFSESDEGILKMDIKRGLAKSKD